MSPASVAQRKAAERARKREQGLVLKQVWVPPDAWPIIADLATQEVEEAEHAAATGGGSSGGAAEYSDGVPVSYAYEKSLELAQDIMAEGEAVLGDGMGHPFFRHVIRAMLKTYSTHTKPDPEWVTKVRKEME